ncbi:thiamine diphosphokinase [Peptostreptococcus sp.]|uniref:thiamine diphosphokinase n=1 Tax=Peptostreptococcus sp. TaxID=1262 RepID=UPI002FC60D4A
MSSNRACLMLNGEVEDYDVLKEIIKSKNYGTIIAVDGGSNHLYNMGILPDYIVGDLDSIDKDVLDYYDNKEVEFFKYPSKKNETDSELGIILAIERGNMCIDVFAALGGRIDHEISNIGLLYYILKRGAYPRIISEKEEVYILENDELTLEGNPGDLVSVIPFRGDAKGVTLRNLEYPLDEFDMEYSVPRGVSNVMLDNICHIDVRDGCVLVVKIK